MKNETVTGHIERNVGESNLFHCNLPFMTTSFAETILRRKGNHSYVRSRRDYKLTSSRGKRIDKLT